MEETPEYLEETPEYFYSPIALGISNESPLLLYRPDSNWLPFSEAVRLQYPDSKFHLDGSGYQKPVGKYRNIVVDGYFFALEIIEDHEWELLEDK